MKYKTAFALIFILLLFQGCSHIPTPVERYNTLNTLTNEQNLSMLYLLQLKQFCDHEEAQQIQKDDEGIG